MNSIRRVLTYGGGVVGTLGGAVASRSSAEGPVSALNDAQHVVEGDAITIQPQAREGSRSLHMQDVEHRKPEDVSRQSRASIVEHLHEIERNPIQRDEIDSLMQADSSSYYELVPPQLRNSIVLDSRMFEFGRELLSRDPELASTMSRSLATMLMMAGGDVSNSSGDESGDENVADEPPNDSGESSDDREEYEFASASILQSQHGVERLNHDSFANVGASLIKAGESETSAEWAALRQQYPCMICQDVMCAPHLVVECAHSFCGGCIRQHIEINKQDCDAACCPRCRHPIERPPCFEPDFDTRILADVDAAPDCESKRYWTEKREVVMGHIMRRRRQKGKHERSQSTASWLWETVKDNMAGIIGVVALILIVVAARRSGR